MNKRSLTSVIRRLARCCKGLELGIFSLSTLSVRGIFLFSSSYPAPAVAGIDMARINKLSLLVPHEIELEILIGMPVNSVKEIETAGRSLVTTGVKTLIVTMGDKGAMLVTDQQCPVPRQWS